MTSAGGCQASSPESSRADPHGHRDLRPCHILRSRTHDVGRTVRSTQSSYPPKGVSTVSTNSLLRTIVVGVEGSAGAAEALRWAVAEGELHNAEVIAVTAWGFLDQHQRIVAERFDTSDGQDEALATLRTSITDAVGPALARNVRAEAACDLPPRALLHAADRADLLVVGARGLGGLRGLLMGSVSQHCLHQTTKPIAIVRARADASPARDNELVVVAVDGSPAAQGALRWALMEGRSRKAAVKVIHAWEFPLASYYPVPDTTIDPATYAASSRRLLREALAAENVIDLPDDIEARSVLGDAATVILEEAQNADLVVVGSRGLGGVMSIALGSVALRVSQHADCPVVVIPPEHR